MPTNTESAPVKKVCCQCGIDVSHIKRSKDQFGNYYCANCVGKVNIVKHEPFRPDAQAAVPQVPPVRPASQPVATEAEKDDLALAAPEAAPPPGSAGVPAGGTATEGGATVAAQVVFRPAKDLRWPERCVGCFAENPPHTLQLGVAPATEFGSSAKMGKLNALLRGLTVRLTSSGRHETGHYSLPVCDTCRAELSDGDVAALAGQTDNVEPPPYRVQTPLLAREIEQKCIVLGFRNQEYACAFREANAAGVFDSVAACVAASQQKAEAPAPASTSVPLAACSPVPTGGQATSGTPAQDEQSAEAPQTLILQRPNFGDRQPISEQPVAPGRLPAGGVSPRNSLSPGDVTPPALPAVGFLKQVEGLEAKPEIPRRAEGPAAGGALPPPPVAAQIGVPRTGAATGPRGVPPVGEGAGEQTTRPQQPPALPSTTTQAPLEEQVLELLQGQTQTQGLSVTPDIAPEKLAAATHACEVPDAECALALVDCTALGTAANALVFGCRGIYYHNGAGSKNEGRGTVPYAEFPRRVFGVGGAANELALGFGQFLDIAACLTPRDSILALLEAVKELVALRTRRPGSASQPPPPPRLPEAAPLLDDLRQLAKTHLPEGPLKVLGAATWEAEGKLGAKLGTLLVRKSAPVAPKEYRAGLLAIIGDKLFVADLGTAAGTDITLASLKAMGPAKVRNCRLRALRAQCTECANAITLELSGDIQMQALFLASCGNDNPAKAVEIATAIRCA